jgi:hypothetical protein
MVSSGTQLGVGFFHKGMTQNSKHNKAYCHGCVVVKLGLEPEGNDPEQCFHDNVKYASI